MQSFQRDGLTFPVRDEGPSDGEAVVLLHGFPQDASAYDAVVPLLHERGLRTLVPTQRGYAASARPSARRAYRTEDTTADVLALLDAAQVERAHIVGHDWGGAPAWAMGAWHPQRVASLVVLSLPHPAAFVAACMRSSQALRSFYMGVFQLPRLPELIPPPVTRQALRRSGLPASYVDHYAEAVGRPDAATGALNWYRGIPFSRRTVGSVPVPTTYVWGRRDFFLGRAAAELT